MVAPPAALGQPVPAEHIVVRNATWKHPLDGLFLGVVGGDVRQALPKHLHLITAHAGVAGLPETVDRAPHGDVVRGFAGLGYTWVYPMDL